MAIVTIVIHEGRDQPTRDRLMQALTDAVCESLAIEPRQVRVVIQEVSRGSYAVAGKTV
jgi:4-oxalocrotonate tautomerase